ncbi:MAG: glycosyltransferase [Gemmatimonadetes bacterium]|nr:glycosyltransferase [Gemmatimonadota bacterium]MBK9693173.1 glycosyltransferase [Gemmatimonadota bacterium]
MRAIIASHTYIDPATRGKLRALTGLGVTLSVAVPARWSPTARGPLLSASWGNDGGIRLIPIPVTGDRGESVGWKASDLHRLFADFRPDIVQVEAEPWTPLAAAATSRAARLGIPTTLFAWESVPRSFGFMERWRRTRSLGRARALIGGNRLAADLLSRERPGVPVAVIPQVGLTPPLEVVRPDHTELAIGFVGRLIPEKGLDSLFRACVKLLGRWRLTVVGSGPAQESLEQLAERLGIASRVTWRGPVPSGELHHLWRELDCLVVPSRTTPQWVETFHPALVEAMGHGVTVVGTDAGALPELIDTAGLVVPEDDVGALTAALQHLSDAPRDRARLGREARLRVMAEFVDDAVARRTLEFWQRVLAPKA